MKITPSERIPANPVDMPGAKDVRMRLLIGPDDGAPNFAMRKFHVQPGGSTPHHQHPYEHEIYVLAGTGVAVTESGERPFKPHDVIFVPASETHQFRNTGQAECQFLCLIPVQQKCT